MTFHILGMSSSQLTNSIIFQRGRSTTNQYSFYQHKIMFQPGLVATQRLPSHSIGSFQLIIILLRMYITTNVGKTMPYLPSPSHHHFYRWYSYHSQSWVVYGIVLPPVYSHDITIVHSKIIISHEIFPLIFP